MKKVLIGIICLLSIFAINVKADEDVALTTTAKEPVTVYIFRGSGCSHCYEALEYFNSLGDEYADVFEVKVYEVWNNSSNAALMEEVTASLGLESTGVPLIIIGESYHEAGFSSALASTIIEAAKMEAENEDYTDIVKPLAENSSASMQTLEEACIDEGIVAKPTTPGQIIALVSICVLLVGGCVALVAGSRKN